MCTHTHKQTHISAHTCVDTHFLFLQHSQLLSPLFFSIIILLIAQLIARGAFDPCIQSPSSHAASCSTQMMYIHVYKHTQYMHTRNHTCSTCTCIYFLHIRARGRACSQMITINQSTYVLIPRWYLVNRLSLTGQQRRREKIQHCHRQILPYHCQTTRIQKCNHLNMKPFSHSQVSFNLTAIYNNVTVQALKLICCHVVYEVSVFYGIY